MAKQKVAMLTAGGLALVFLGAMAVVFFAKLEGAFSRVWLSSWFVLAFALACALGSIYGFLQGAWPFGLVEAIWAGVALRRWMLRQRSHS